MFQQISIRTSAYAELMDITHEVQEVVSDSKVKEGICCVFIPHTTAGVTINENADPSVKKDILMKLDKVVDWNDRNYAHSEGNSAAHIKASCMGFSESIIIQGGRLQLGTWQNIYFAEFDGPRSRRVFLHML